MATRAVAAAVEEHPGSRTRQRLGCWLGVVKVAVVGAGVAGLGMFSYAFVHIL